ncbi:Hof1 [Kluyveromyces lactis]|nr:Hof1 [Kluyveromyces lactis]
MTQIYNYQESFWDEDDQGVTVLLQHVGRGICTCELLLDCFTKRSELEMDYARRLGALSARIMNNLERYADYNNMSESLKYFQSSQQTIANGHSKAYERLNRENVGTMSDFLKQYRARWSTITGNVENLRKLKDEKKKALKSIDQELLSAENKLREYQLNKETALGEYQRKENARELEKWSSIVEESHRRKTVLHHEYKAARAHWFEEWRHISGELQSLETQRIQVSRELLQQYADFTTQPSELELSLMEQLKQKLSSFTPELEISHFSYHHGTGRIKLKNSNSVSTHNSSANSNPSNVIRLKSSHKALDLTKNDRYVQNIKRLSTQLKNTRLNSINALSVDKELPTPKTDAALVNSIESKVLNNNSAPHSVENYSEVVTKPGHGTTLSESSEETSSNPTDFTHRKNKASYDSMSTSLSSMASSVDDSQRFAKSWNSRNRRKSRPSSMYSPTMDMDTSDNDNNNSLKPPTANRRKSIASDVETALEILEKNDRPITSRTSSGASSNLTVSRTVLPFSNSLNIMRCKRVTIDGEQLNLPIVDSMKNPVIKYVKAIYSYTEPNENNILLFSTGDILLLVECINDDWYVGEVYQGNKQHGLVPMNYVKVIN